LEGKKKEILKKIDLLNKEKEKLSRWLLKSDITPQSVNYINIHIDDYAEKERELQEQLWEIEDKITSIQHKNYNAGGLSDYLKDFVNAFNNDLDDGEKKLLIESLIDKVVIKENKKVTVT